MPVHMLAVLEWITAEANTKVQLVNKLKIIHFLNLYCFLASSKMTGSVKIEGTTRKGDANQPLATFSAHPGNLQLKNQRIEEYFTRESNGCSQLIKQGKPNVFL